jgi:phage terminase small subunit
MNKLRPKQKKFVDAYLETGNGTEAVVRAGYNVKDRNVARVVGSQNLAKLNIIEYLQSHAKGAASRIVQMSMEAENEAVKFNANRDILDRAGFQAPEKDEKSNNIFVINLSDKQKENLRRLFSPNV